MWFIEKSPTNYSEEPISVTLVAAIRRSGPFAAHSFVGAMNAERFRAWVNVHLVPGLRKGDVVIMDNLPVHKDAEARRAIEKAGSSE